MGGRWAEAGAKGFQPFSLPKTWGYVHEGERRAELSGNFVFRFRCVVAGRFQREFELTDRQCMRNTRSRQKGLAYKLNAESNPSPQPLRTFRRGVMERCRFSRKYEFNLDGSAVIDAILVGNSCSERRMKGLALGG